MVTFSQIVQSRLLRWLLVGLIASFCFACLAVDRSLYLPPYQDFRLVVISDLNSQYGSTTYEPEVKQAIALMPQWQPDLVLCGGDMIAGQKAALTKSQIQAMWTAFDRQIVLPLRQDNIPFGFTIGNHDGSGAVKNNALVFKQERELAQAYWSQASHQLGLNFIDRADFPFYYSFLQDDIFFLVWDASTHEISPQQLAWVQQQLASPTATQAKLKIAIGHLPLYPVAEAKNKPGEYLADGAKLRSLLGQNQVKVYISGHHHVYYPGKQENLELLHAGALGQGERQLINSNLPPRKTLTVIDIDQAKSQLTYHTYDAKTWELIPIESLPPFIESDRAKIIRRDLSQPDG